MTRPSIRADAIFGLIVILLCFVASPSNAQSSWERCENNDNWADRIAACQAVIQSGDTAKRLAVAHFYVANNLELSYDQHLRGNNNKLDKELSNLLIESACDPILAIFSGDSVAAQRRCDEAKALYGSDQARIGEPTTTDIQRVLDEYNTALRYDPAYMEARFRRIFILGKQNRNKEALADYDALVRDQPNDYEVRYLRGETYYKIGSYAAAIQDFNAALDGNSFTNEQKLQVYDLRGYAYFQTKNFDAAILDYTSAINIDGNKWQVYAQRGRAYSSGGKPNEAAADFERALSFSPPQDSQFELYWMRGMSRTQIGDRVGAIDDFDNVLDIKEDAQIYNARGRIQFELKKFSEAKDDLTKALTLGLPDALTAAQAYELRAFAAMYLQDNEAAISDFSTVIETHPAQHLFFHRGNLNRQFGNQDAALADFQTVIAGEQSPEPMRLQSYLGRAMLFHGRQDVENAMANYDAFFAGLANTDDQTRAIGAQIIQNLVSAGIYSGTAEKYDTELRNALATCVSSPQCSP